MFIQIEDEVEKSETYSVDTTFMKSRYNTDVRSTRVSSESITYVVL